MKRDLELIRAMLLDLESLERDLHESNFGFDHELAAKRLTTNPDYYSEHLILLYQAGLINGWVKRGKMAAFVLERTQLDHDYILVVMPRGLTWAGHEFLETVRDPEIWKKTKASAMSVGNFGFDTIKELAVGFIKQKIKQHTGKDIEFTPPASEA